MAQVFLRPQSNPSAEQAYQAVTLYFGEVNDHKTESGYSLIRNCVPDLQHPYHGLCFWIENLTFTDGQVVYTVVDYLNEASPLTGTPILDDDLEKVDPYGTADRFTVNFKDSAFETVTLGIKPDDFDLTPYRYFVKDGQVYRALTRSATWNATTQYYKSKKIYKMQYNVVNSGIINFDFGFTTMFGQSPSGYGMVFTVPNDTSYSVSWNVDSWDWGMPNIDFARGNSFYGCGVNVSSSASYKGPYTEAFPVAFTIPAHTTISGYGGTWVVEENTQYYGAIIIQYDQYGIAKKAFVEAVEEKCWAAPTHPHGDYGPNTPAYGGAGRSPVKRDDPRQNIMKGKVGGILTNPTSGKGIVIYKMDELEFTDFIRKFTDTSFSGFAEGLIQNPLTNPIQMISNAYNYLNKDADNILFVKKSPVEFYHSDTHNFSKLMIGSAEIHDVSAQVVLGWWQEGAMAVSLKDDSDLGQYVQVNDFTDLEPYTSAEIYCPLASPVQIPPSYLCNSTLGIDWGFNLLDSSATYTINLHTGLGGGYIQLATSGMCCSNAETLIAKKDTSTAVESIGALVAKGVSTVATGGLTAPDLVTTAAGAAMTAVPSSQQMVLSNLPTSGSSIPYNDCIVGGRRSLFLTITKSVRFSSGEESNDSGRATVQGKFSNFYVSSLYDVGDGNYASVLDVKLDMESKMTKSEYDKIIALLHEGVWL